LADDISSNTSSEAEWRNGGIGLFAVAEPAAILPSLPR
jgi:hypothetical protein